MLPRRTSSPAGGSGDAEHAPPSRQKRKSRQMPQGQTSNRSSPEGSPERNLKIRPLTSASGARHGSPGVDRNGKPRKSTRSPDRRGHIQHQHQHQHQLQHAGVQQTTSGLTPPQLTISADETPSHERLSYFGSNESERSDSVDGEDGDASSSEDSASELLDAALGIDRAPLHVRQGSTSTLSGPRRELLVQRPVLEQQGFTASWENALLKPIRNSVQPQHQGSRARSSTPVPHSSSLASRRKGSPSHLPEAGPGHRSNSSPSRSPTPSQPSTPAARPRLRIPFRIDLLPEVALLTASLILAAYRMAVLPMPDDLDGNPMPDIPLSPLIMLIFIIPGVALFRQKGFHSNYMFPFTDERGYRSPALVDDGFAAGATIPVLLAAGFLWDVVVRGDQDVPYLGHIRPLMEVWQAAGLRPQSGIVDATPAQIYSTVVVARISLLLSTSINSFILVFHIILSRTVLKVERLPTNNTKRLFGALLLSCSVSLFLWTLLALNDAFAWATPYISPAEAGMSSLIYQMSMYTVSRLVRRGFTLGELSIATGSGISLCLEFWRVSASRLFYCKYGGIPATFRIPTPLLPFQHVMIPGAFLTGFMLSPLLVLSRNFAQRPSHRLKRPEERERNRKWSALGVFTALLLVVFFVFGGWAGWSLGGGLGTAWAWGARFAVLGTNGVSASPLVGSADSSRWQRSRRIFLALYWLAITTAAVGGWQTRLVRARRIRLAKTKNSAKSAESGSSSVATVSKALLETIEVRDIRGERRMHVALDLRRKFFHALAVIMFVPAIAIDPAFTSLAFSLAFAIFTFAEYARFFAVVPIGAPIHVFFSEFVDAKDAGPVILSHFYLLTGCAGGLWLEGKGIAQFTGVLAVGIGDAFASILGRRIGIAKWPNSNKTLFGTAAFIASIFWSAMLLRATGLVAPFSAPRYLIATVLSGLLEAWSAQNDNLVIPIFFWSLIALLEV